MARLPFQIGVRTAWTWSRLPRKAIWMPGLTRLGRARGMKWGFGPPIFGTVRREVGLISLLICCYMVPCWRTLMSGIINWLKHLMPGNLGMLSILHPKGSNGEFGHIHMPQSKPPKD